MAFKTPANGNSTIANAPFEARGRAGNFFFSMFIPGNDGRGKCLVKRSYKSVFSPGFFFFKKEGMKNKEKNDYVLTCSLKTKISLTLF